MGSHNLIFRVIIFIFLFLIIDLYLWYRLGRISRTLKWVKYIRHTIFPVSIAFGVLLFAYIFIAKLPGLDPVAYRRYFLFTGALQVIWLPRLLFMLVDVLWLLPIQVFRQNRATLTKIAFYFSMMFWGIVSLLCLHAIFLGKTAFQVKEIKLEVVGLPLAFEGFRIVQLSDAHLGSFGNEENVRKGLRILDTLDADIIVFTGDLINTSAEEAWPYREDWARLSSKHGKFAILGNHDIGDYVKGDTIRPPEVNRALLRAFYHETGFILLEDSAIAIRIDRDTLVMAGVDNWGLPPFRQGGNLRKALGLFPGKTTLLLTHDPSHWDAEVLQHQHVFLCLSGHTHGMQFGLNTNKVRWSPVQYKYPRWVGLYKEGHQFLYVNPGFGFIGLPSRLGIYPEITVIILENSIHRKPTPQSPS